MNRRDCCNSFTFFTLQKERRVFRVRESRVALQVTCECPMNSLCTRRISSVTVAADADVDADATLMTM